MSKKSISFGILALYALAPFAALHANQELANNNNGITVNADVLYWKPHISGLELDFGTNSLVETITDGTQIIATDEFDSDPHFKWNVGYRIGAEYQFCDANWDVGVVWTHFQDSGHRSITESTDVDNSIRCSLKFDQIDLLMGYQSDTSCEFTFKPFVGLRGARIRESVHAFLVTDITLSPATPATETRTFDDDQTYTGLGPIIGFGGEWDFGCGFSLYGSAAASFLYGKYKVNFDDSDIFSAPLSRSVFSTNSRHMRCIDWNIDVTLGIRWETYVCDCYRVDMQLGLEHHQYFNQSHLGAHRGDLTLDGAVFSVGVSL